MQYRTLREKIRAEKMERLARYAEFERIYQEAREAGHQAAMECVPQPMVVTQRANPLRDDSPVMRQWHVSEGVCGFAWVTVRPATSSFARWLVKHKDCRTGYYGGVEIWVRDYGQSMERKHAYANAFANVLVKHGIQAGAYSRLD
jgi:hypothetical protein